MLTIYHSNKLDLLKNIAVRLISQCKLPDPLQQELILVNSYCMAQWIQMELACSFDIAANINFYLPANFIWKIYNCLLPDFNIEKLLSKSAMTWRIMKIMQRLYNTSDFNLIRESIKEDIDKRKQFHFAISVADLFDQYLIFRPDWLEIWLHGKQLVNLGDHQRWQAKLWQALIEDIFSTKTKFLHFDNLYQSLLKTIQNSDARRRLIGLPERIFIFGLPSLPPLYMKIINLLGNYIDIHLMFINPYRNDRIKIDSNTCLKLNNQIEPNIGNPLLKSWGKLGRDTISIFSKLKNVHNVEDFLEFSSGEECLLSVVQRDILEDYSLLNNKKRLLQPKDRSISIHVCHSPQREIEVLHDNLLYMIAENKDISPREVIVMVADIDIYAPAINAVFGNATEERYLPFSIYDYRVKNFHPVLKVFLSLLKLPFSRCTSEEILALLDIPALAARFSMSKKNINLLGQWIAESGIRWGLDDDMLSDLMFPAATGQQHTWQFGLHRMLLGYAMDKNSGTWQDILPYNESSGLIAELIGKLAELLVVLRRWRNYLIQSRPLNQWLTSASDIINDFFISTIDIETEAALTLVVNHWQQMLQFSLESNYDEPVSIILLHDELTMRLAQEGISKSFFLGKINFCTMMPMRSIPFKIVCLLGMNDGVYPHTTIFPVSFDLIAQHPRLGDSNRRDEDRYIFLEALLSAKYYFYISFIGTKIQDNSSCYPSVLVSELTNYITQSFYLSGDEQLKEQTIVRNIRNYLWQLHSRMPFAPENFITDSENQSYSKEWFLAAKAAANVANANNHYQKPQYAFISSLSSMQEEIIVLDDLKNFYKHTVRTFFQKRLAIWLDQEQQYIIPDTEPFQITDLNNFNIKEKILNTLIEKNNIEIIYQQVRTAGMLSYGAFGKIYWKKECNSMMKLAANIRLFILPKFFSQEVKLTIGKTDLIGWLPRVQNNGLLRWRPSAIYINDGLQLWIEHLAYCAIGGHGDSRLFGTNGYWHFSVLSEEEAKNYLLTLVNGYWQGMSEPLLLLNRSGGAWLNHCFNRNTNNIDWNKQIQQEAKDKMIQSWKGDKFFYGEKRDPYLQLLIRKLNKEHITAIIQAAESYFMPILKHNNIASYF
ncbi:exodeoxyribonuclease V subunit gamma [Candidatus Palibaumannia cicadellinicola]|nr:exodeoxyribonuclease V subunit gamma [Candidatus Baumannia cicadellinicola]